MTVTQYEGKINRLGFKGLGVQGHGDMGYTKKSFIRVLISKPGGGILI
jgi:hypothetical protein